MKLSVLSSILFAGGALALPGNVIARASTTSTSPSATGKVKYVGVNVAGFDFGVTTDGTQNLTNVYPPIGGQYPDGPAQMSHFATKDGHNIFRLPVGWQYILGGQLGGKLNQANLAKYDTLLQGCLKTGAVCIIDIHNYARWNGKIIGQGGPTDAQFVDLWTQIATRYKSTANVAFGVMNEPHEVDIKKWAAFNCATRRDRNSKCRSDYTNEKVPPAVLLPGNDYTSAGAFITNGSGEALLPITNPDNSTTNLIFDVHKYLDSDNSGTHAECVTDNISTAFQPLATWLRTNGRQALNSETGGGNVASCAKYLCAQIAFLNQNSDVYLGYVGWSAGSFDQTYTLTMTPMGQGNNMQDTSLVKACLMNK